MGNLSNLYISQSYQSLIHLGNDSFVSSSLVGLQDGLGNSIGVAVNSAGDLSISGSLTSSLQQGYVWVGNANGRTTTVPTSSFGGGGTGSAIPAGTISGSSQITALGFVSSSVTGSSLITGSVVGNVLTFTKGDASQFSLTVATGSGGGGTIETGSFATTGSNIFIGNQTITGSVNLSGGNRLFVKRSTIGSDDILRLGVDDNGNNFEFLVTGSGVNPGQKVWGINVGGGIWNNSFDSGVVFNGFVTASAGLRVQSAGTFSAPLQQGNVWVGDANGRNMIVPTSSFAGAVPVGTATTGSNTFNGNQTINGEVKVIGSTPYYTAAGNTANSGAQFPTFDTIITNNNNEFGGFNIYKQGNYPNSSFLSLAATAYSPQYGGTTIPMIIANGNNPGGNDSAIIWKSDGTAEHWKKSDFKYGINVTGSTELQGFTSSLQQGYVFVGGANGRTTTVATSSFGGGSTDITALNAFTASQNTKNSTLATYTGSNDTKWNTLGGVTGSYATTGSNVFRGNQTITGSLTLSSSAAIELNVIGNSSFTGSTAITGPFTALIPTASNESQIDLFKLPTFLSSNGTTYTNAAISLIDYASVNVDQTFAIEYGNASFEKYSSLFVGPSKTQFSIGKGSGYDYDVIELLDNNNNTSTAKVKATNIILEGPTQLTGSLNVSGTFTSSLQQGYAWVGNSSGKTISVPTASFAGAAPVGTATTGSNIFNGNQTISGSLTISSSAAIELNVIGGSSFTGSVNVTGSASVNGSPIVTASQTGSFILNLSPGSNPLELSYDLGNGGGGFATLVGPTSLTGSVRIAVDNQLYLPTGSNQQAGTAVLDGGSPSEVTVSNDLVTANSIIMLTKQTFTASSAVIGVTGKTGGQFTIVSNASGDTDTVGWVIINNS